MFKGEKVSKSKGGLYTLSELEEKGYNSLSFRYLCLLINYRKPLNFSIEILNSAMKAYLRLKNIVSELKKSTDKKNRKNIDIAKKQFLAIINDDFNSSRGISFLWEILRDNRLNDAEKYELALDFDNVLGLDLDKEEEEIKIPLKIKNLMEKREKARKEEDWKKGDELKKEAKKEGYLIIDTPGDPSASWAIIDKGRKR